MVRRATRADADSVADVFIPSFRGLMFLPKLHSDEETRSWVGNVVLATHEVWVAEDEGRVVGFAALESDVLGHLYVHPDAQSRGIGSALFDLVKRQRPDGFRLWVFQRNAGARRFYERHECVLVELTDGSGNEEREPDALYAWRPGVGRRTETTSRGSIPLVGTREVVSVPFPTALPTAPPAAGARGASGR